MEPHVPIAEGADGNAVHLDVGDKQDFRIELPRPLRPLAQRLGGLFARAKRTELGSEPQLVFLGQILSAHTQDQMLVPRLLNLFDHLGR